MYKRNTGARSRNHFCQEEISVTYSECVSVALVMHHAMRMRRVILSSVACPTLTIFFHVTYKQHHVREKVTEHVRSELPHSFLSETFFIRRRMEILSQMCIGFRVKYPLLLSDFNGT